MLKSPLQSSGAFWAMCKYWRGCGFGPFLVLVADGYIWIQLQMVEKIT